MTVGGSPHGGPSASSTPTSRSSPPPTVAGCPVGHVGATAACVEAALSKYWTAELHRKVDEKVVLRPAASRVPGPCVAGLREGTAFTCQANRTLYVTDTFLGLMGQYFSGPRMSYALAAVQAHEIGHIVQLLVHQPQLAARNPTLADRRFLEQQADCLGGVWAGVAARHAQLDATEYRAVSVQLITLVSDAAEVSTHGTPSQRAAAIERGIAGATPAACRLNTFS